MKLSKKDLSQLKALRNFLKKTFGGTSFGKLKIDECIETLEVVILSNELDK